MSLLNKGDHDAFTEIYDRYAELLYRHAHKVLGDTEACNDVVQDVFLMIWNRRNSLEITDSLSAYLYKTVRNKVLDYISHQQVAERYADTIRDFVNQGAWITEDYIREKELLTIIESEKAKLSPRVRQVYELNRELDLSYKQIGQQLNISEKTVKKQVHNALRIIRLKIGSLLSLSFFF
ncbi:RNA polymerase sigma-70 factor [Parapedobacter tibetensis]|uniref:RNA polymerase sigma-70 factor n=1 Tax=Parapedobacter tibetensis TaxID=2972951 RepID=UPI00214D5986|nr:RNA polymerase sigma-70 factor [Parapedobacter tibetensis]